MFNLTQLLHSLSRHQFLTAQLSLPKAKILKFSFPLLHRFSTPNLRQCNMLHLNRLFRMHSLKSHDVPHLSHQLLSSRSPR